MNTNIKNNEPLFQKKQNKEKSLNLKQKLYLCYKEYIEKETKNIYKRFNKHTEKA